MVSRRKLLRIIDQASIQKAIRRAEQRTSGEICVSVAPVFWGNVQKAAEKTFVRMGMTATKDRNAVLFFVVPSRRKFAVVGDSGIHEKVGQGFWEHIAEVMSERFRQSDFTDGIVAGIDEVGEQLAVHFPYQASQDRDELSNEIDFGEG
jgi:uncharacterized membrane protein